MTRRTAIAALLAVTLAGCGLFHFDPVTAEDREVTRITDPAKTLTLLEPMVWTNGRTYETSTKGERLPEGTYVLEGEDAEYLYFKAPKPIEMRVLKDGKQVDGRDIPGGLALAKSFKLVPAATYLDVGPREGTVTLVFKHGGEFMEMRGEKWKTSF